MNGILQVTISRNITARMTTAKISPSEDILKTRFYENKSPQKLNQNVAL